MENIYELEHVSKFFGKLAALEGLTINIGRVPTAVLGYSGAGKTTLLRLLAGLETPSAGKIIFRQKEVTEASARNLRRVVTMLFQETVSFNQTVLENVVYGLRVRGVTKEEATKRARESLAKLRLEGYEKRKTPKLSGGEKQRVSLARALVLEPEVLLLDEPTSNLDPANASVMAEIIREYSKKGLVIISTHNFFDVRKLTDWAIYIEKGRVVETGPTDSLLDNPNDVRTRRFVNGLFSE